MGTTSGQSIVDPAMEVWGAVLTRYLSAMGVVILHYDCLLTMKDEMRLVWPGALSLPKVLYYINRYIAFVAILFCNYQIAGLRPAVPISLCQAWIVVSGVSMAICTSSATALLGLRVTALYRHTRWFTRLLWISFALFQGLRSSMMILATVSLFGSLTYSPISNQCIPVNTDYRTAGIIAVPGIFDFLLLVLTLTQGIKSTISLRAVSSSSMMYTLVRDELLYFSVISTLRIFNSIAWLVLSPSLIGVGIYAEWGLESALISRFFLNLRSIAYHESSVSESQTVPSTLSPIRTRPTRKQTKLTTSIFIELETGKRSYNSGGNLNEGDIRQPQVVDLGVLEWQAHDGRDMHDFGEQA